MWIGATADAGGARPDPAVAPRAGCAAAARARALRLLLAEDNDVNQRIGVAMLRRWVTRVLVVENGRDAVEQPARGDFDAVLMDVQMPEMSGFDATTAIRTPRTLHRPPRPHRRAHRTRDGRRPHRCLEAGMDDYLTKPLTIAALPKSLDRVRSRTGCL